MSDQPVCQKPWRYDSGQCNWPKCGCDDMSDQRTTDPIRAWRQWRQAEAAYNRAAAKLDNWTREISDEFHAFEIARDDAWKLACRLLDAATLTLDKR